ncbi:endo-1,4-beta-xylanase [Flavimarina sp. Hel_I_48]|uniref:endo-1,4-beta-xylanase n=1 Tax=Flavimarina sp. Hel_I_48 TaxID=1392488 RepID=UPI0005692891|nr:endo-1,4-beta-xylanase [Flavimarina sp. Hel_I_48]
MRIFNSRVVLLLFAVSIGLCSCKNETKTTNTDVAKTDQEGLKDYYKEYFPMGVAVSPRALKDSSQAALITTQFKSMTPENVMKMGPLHPEQNRYNWGPADEIIAFAEANDMIVRGHNLIWHQQYPDWFFKDADGNQITKDTLYTRMKKHITDVVSRYKGKIYAWDVVNEAVSDDSTKVYREESPFYKIAGEDYLAKAFEYAHEADPDVKLYYNDYNAVRPEKRERIYTLVKKLVDAGVPIDGVGIQGHWSIFEPTEDELKKAIAQYSSLDLDVQVTELDISLYKWEKESRKKRADEQDDFIPELEQKQIDQYDMVFNVFRENKGTLTGVTFWNISDQYTWLDTYPVPGRKNYPLLFDENLKPKKAFYKVTDINE